MPSWPAPQRTCLCLNYSTRTARLHCDHCQAQTGRISALKSCSYHLEVVEKSSRMDADERALLAEQAEFLGTRDRVPAAKISEPGQSPGDAARKRGGSDGTGTGEQQSGIEDVASDANTQDLGLHSGMIRDVVERQFEVSAYMEPQYYTSRPSAGPKRIDWRTKGKLSASGSRFAASRVKNRSAALHVDSKADNLTEQIDEENKAKLGTMSESEIAAERRELLQSLDPGILAALSKRYASSRHTPLQDDPPEFGPRFTSQEISSIPVVKTTSKFHEIPDRVGVDNTGLATESPLCTTQIRSRHTHEHDIATTTDTHVEHVHNEDCLRDTKDNLNSIHFPTDKPAKALDPNSETFLEDLKTKYFPNLEHNPSSLAWMRQPTEAEDISDYHESQASIMPAQVRFDFQGNFVAPRMSREVDSDLGLHHHADAPLAAGYTIPELAHLSRSSYPAQACMAIQTIGRVMYKIGKHFYGDSISGKLRGLIAKTKIEQTLLERSMDRHMGISSYSTEALWQANLGREGQVIEGQ